MILKGQNFRILVYDTTAAKFKCVGMSTNCTITLNTKTDDGSTKDDVGMAAKPIVNSKSWQVQVDSLNVQDSAAMLTAIKSFTPFELLWDVVSTSDNQTPDYDNSCREGTAYLADATFNFNDRENSSKSLTFIGSSGISYPSEPVSYQAISEGSYTKGQFVRLFLSDNNTIAPNAVIAAAKTLSLHVSLQMESATTKDTQGSWDVQEPTALNYDISTSALVYGNDIITSSVAERDLSGITDILDNGTPVKWKIANTSGSNNRTAGAVIVSGSALLTQITINSPNRQNATYTVQMTGYGAYTVGS